MIYIDKTPNPSGAYPNPKNQPFPGCIALNDEQAAVFFEYNGFVFVENGVVTPNTDAWEEWKTWLTEASKPTAEEVRAERDKRLAETDWTQVLDAPITAACQEAFRVYRQELRDVPEQDGFSAAVVWPDMPEVVKA